MRSFLALPVPEEAADDLAALSAEAPGGGRAVPVDDLHLTLAFLGDATEGTLEEIHEALSSRVPPPPPISVTGIAPMDAGHGVLLVADVARDIGLLTLQADVERAARRAGADLPRRRFRPHVTLARGLTSGPGLRAWMRGLIGPWPRWTPTEIRLVRSDLRPTGARYETLAAYPLALR
ncbi:RNA 2',3'-cyclic phosphodiesterase [Jannaschia aquimarina]|uniref:RNA 2',3'-cyclic phosphodiesterase n=1 Tax=Jannaschia aquimarina TaxID=935700 RepID=A0A0D1EQT5_9RHOB|nr:RNA 2',3'-cyclic phosphodiesterase [Jannaschia aquimarina]KIT18005.1 2',5' RNA ligase family [Jannaschia aquimarina]SNS88364.1 2'-5' RNA ligase [Jannaschia aquimarina]